MNKKIGFIGAGKMAQAMLEGILKSKMIPKENIIASAKTEGTLEKIESNYQIRTTQNNQDVARFADILILAVKPDQHSNVIQEIKNNVHSDSIIITIAAGITLDDIEREFGINVKAVRTMPNTPSFVGEGMTAICSNERLNEEEVLEVELLFHTFGKTERLDERLMDAVPAISGSSPAYVYMMIEAMADGGVKQGIPRDKAYRLAAQAVLGAAKMVLETDRHPGELKDNVCTPGGATIEAVAELEKRQFRGSVLAAMESCTRKVKSLQ
ncbi:pyrroline-5-carboxylate reductase [Neobacillus sp. 179-C4.2 HS]|uniref:Pyrroline-5-carboxylate reductase n=1 Tax=Neobacillus driksii TaxID=3035913 RepID=A0ABV4YX95_9BACI|nr:pyrroline-5-carboxylate reductase [Neobacillus sp. 179.-C4.2 HS]MDP5196603.1 pyrroline-5-carboxylate reductase [Neobacillus sp. 179.-C4.2 HS]